MENGKQFCEEPSRKRGRPAGKNRVPLTKEQQKARNAQYERERRLGYSEAMAELGVAAGCPSDTNSEMLFHFVMDFLKRAQGANSSKDLDELKRINKNLQTQIQSCKQRLGIVHDSDDEEEQTSSSGSAGNSSPHNDRRVDYASTDSEFEVRNAPPQVSLLDISQTEDEVLSYMKESTVEDFIYKYL